MHQPILITVGRKKKMSWVFSLQPSYFVDFFFNLQAFQIVKLGFMTLESTINVILAPAHITVFRLKKDSKLQKC